MSDPIASHASADASLVRLLVDAVEDYAIFAIRPDGMIASWNAGAERIKGYSAAEAIGRPYAMFFTDADRARGLPARLLAAAADNGSASVEGWRVRKDGSRFRASAVLTALRDADGALAGFAKVTRDVTAARAAEEALRLRERQLSDTQDLAGLGSWVWDVAEDRVTWTDKLYEIYGLDRETFTATFAGYLERVHPDDRDRVRSLIEEAYGSGSTFDFEERIVRPDGSIRHLRSRGRAVRDEKGRSIRLMGACLDITDLKLAEAQALELATEQAARAAAERYAAGLGFLAASSKVLASSLDFEQTLRTVAELAVPEVADWCAVDLLAEDGSLRRVAVAHPDPAQIEVAKRLAARYPGPRDASTGIWHVIDTGEPELYAEIPEELITRAATDAEHLQMLRSLGLRSAVTVPLTGRSRVLGGLTLVHAESGRRFDEQDLRILQELGRLAGLAIDNSQLHLELERQNGMLAEQATELELQTEELQSQAHHLEELMTRLEASNEELQERTAEAEHANRAKSDFLATMSHELRTPLNAIFGYADILDLGVHGPVTGAQREALERIKRNQRALLVLINDVLNFAKLEAGKLEVTIADVPVAEVVGNVAAAAAPQLEAKGLHYVNGPVDRRLRLRGERERVEQILLNLLTNAGKFTPQGGSVELSVSADEAVVRLSVRDTGAGIPPDRLQVIFDPFVQLGRQAENTGERGVGLGLAISRDLAEVMKGSLSVESVLGAGSTFTLTLPRAEDAAT
ncbi:MAG TPA: ATP-binding protein [Longimicrobiaceae bacterium]